MLDYYYFNNYKYVHCKMHTCYSGLQKLQDRLICIIEIISREFSAMLHIYV